MVKVLIVVVSRLAPVAVTRCRDLMLGGSYKRLPQRTLNELFICRSASAPLVVSKISFNFNGVRGNIGLPCGLAWLK